MPRFPRVALGSVDAATDYRAVHWALLDQFDAAAIQAQSFYSQASFVSWDAASTVTGRNYRHLDSWLMNEELCREVFSHGMAGADIGIVEGAFNAKAGGAIETLSNWLDLSRWGVVDISSDDPCRQFRPQFPLDGVFLDGAQTPQQLCRERTRLELLWNVPVLGGTVASPHVRAIVDRLPPGARPSRELCRALGQNLVLYRNIDELVAFAARRSFPESAGDLFQPATRNSGLTVAIAIDEAFNCYFPDTLDLLELSGATIRDFSPVRDETLPADADVVVFGCGHPERVAESLANNCCIMAAVKRHVRSGKRIYAEGSGVAYLSRQMVLPNGDAIPMSGLLPIDAHVTGELSDATPTEITLSQDSWLGRKGRQLRGYLNTRWQMRPVGPVNDLSLERNAELNLIGDRNIIASRMYLNLVAQPHLLRGFLTEPAHALARR